MSGAALSSPLTVAGALRAAEERLRAAGISNAAWEAREILAAAVPCRPLNLVLSRNERLTEGRRARLERLVADRCRRRPLAYVLGEWDFIDLRLRVSEDVLVPRPETEELAALTVKQMRNAECGMRNERPSQLVPSANSALRTPNSEFELADVGTGSGCLAVYLAKSLPGSRVWATDVSAAALAVAKENAAAHGAADRVRFLEGDLLSPLPEEVRLDGVVANLPYIDESVLEGLEPEVRFEPAVALSGGRGGLEIVHRLLPQALARLRSGGSLWLEVGYNQGVAAAEAMSRAGFVDVRVEKDFAGVGRFVTGAKR